MNLVQFTPQVGTNDAFAIRARDLDGNFRKLQPVPNGQYGINETQNGWSLNIFPAFPETATQALYLTYTEGSLQWTEGGTISAPPSGTPAWREVERCDGKKMYVWGTEWAD